MFDPKALQQEWGPILERYEPRKILGEGAYGKVIEAEDKTTKKKVAIKMINLLFEDKIDTKRILREITLLRFMKNEYIVQLLDIEYDKNDKDFDTIYLIFECQPSDLKKLIRSSRTLENSEVKKLVYRILCGIKYVHSCAVLHRDIKPGNILIDENFNIKICDFGLARCVNQDIEEPEVIQSRNPHRDLKHKSSLLDNYAGKKKEDPKETSSTSSTSTSATPSGPKRPPKLKELKGMKKKDQMLTAHVASRWYRAPELILIESNYTGAIDIWSVGCIFAELMMMIKENAPTFMDRQPLFPGKCCFPLSPMHSSKVNLNAQGFPSNRADQLNVIFDVIGSPSEEDMHFITDPNGILYLKSMKKKPKCDLKAKFPGSPPEALDLLEQMLLFHPNKRPDVEKCLEHPYFKDIREKKKEIEADFKLEFEFEKDENLTMEKLRDHFLKVINSYKQ